MQIRIFDWHTIDPESRNHLLRRSESGIESVISRVRGIVERVRDNGDAAVREFTREFDRVDLGSLPLLVPEHEVERGIEQLDARVRDALDFAIKNVRSVHAKHQRRSSAPFEVRPGVWAGEIVRPIDSVGLYVPRGRGSFPSMLYMLAVPATLAGVGRITVVTPPDRNGSVDPACLYAARQCGVHAIARVGGAQAIAALTYGTGSIEAVSKIVGPGSAYVAAAKRIVREVVDTGLPAGPSESIIAADDSADPVTVAMDLLIEAEHGADSQALLVTTSRELAEDVAARLPGLVESTPEPRRSFLTTGFESYSGIIVVRDRHSLLEVVNEFAPEHLQVRVADPDGFVEGVRNAGEVLIGESTPFSLANYAIGANAVLPTGGGARVHSGVSVADFQKTIAVMRVTGAGYAEIADHTIRLADYEGFHWHARAVAHRLDGREE